MDVNRIDLWANRWQSIFHQATAGAKLVAVALLLTAIVLSNDIVLLLVTYLSIAAAIGFARLPVGRIIVIGLYPAVFALLYAFSRWNGSLELPAVIVLKALSAALAMLLLITTTPYPAIFAAIQRFLPSVIADGLLLTYRSLFILLQLADQLWMALRLRGGLRHRRYVRNVQNAAMGLGLTFVRALGLSERWYDVLRLRGYHGRLIVGPPNGQGGARLARTPADLAPLGLGAIALILGILGQLFAQQVASVNGYILLLALVACAWGLFYSRSGALRLGAAYEQAGADQTVHEIRNRDLDRASAMPDLPIQPVEPPESGPIERTTDAAPRRSEIGPTPSTMPLVDFDQVIYRYPDGTTLRYEGCTLTVQPGERVLLLGPNGSGKSTLLYLLAGLYSPIAGTVRVAGLDPVRHFDEVRGRIGVLLQNPGEQIVAPTVRDDIAFGPRNYGLDEVEIRARLDELAGQLHITHVLDKVPHYLSGGERVKVALAGILIMRPQLLLLDEPFEGLDTTSKMELTRILNHLRDQYGVAIVVSTHEVNLVPHFVDTIYLLSRGGGVVRRGTPLEVLSDPALLARHHMEPPVLAELFAGLCRAGVDLGTALTVPEAVDRLLQELAVKRARQ